MEKNEKVAPTHTRIAALLTLGGVTFAFSVASCCALPIMLATIGLSAAWLGGIASIAVQFRTMLLIVSAISLLGGAIMLWRMQRRAVNCGPDGICTPPAIRILLAIGLAAGFTLLYLGYIYV